LGVDWRAQTPHRSSGDPPRGLALKTSSFIRHPSNSLLAKAKCNGNYVGGMLALEEAQSSGADDALLLDHAGFVTETSGANLFVVQDGRLLTPPLSCVLEGITRDSVITLAADAGLRVSERQLTRDDVYAADEVFVTGTASELTPVLRVDGRSIGAGSAGPVTEVLRASYVASARAHIPDPRGWLTPVRDSEVREV
jgi:branched-chain amino acid aminotransferase